MSDATNLDTAISAILTALATNAGKPNYTIDGQTVSYDSLLGRLEKLQKMKTSVAGPFEVETVGEA